MQNGIVVEYHREYCWVRLDADGRETIAKPRGRLELAARAKEKDWEKEGRIVFAQQVAVGDRVRVDEPSPGQFVIEEVLPRETWLMRKTGWRYSRKPQCVVANADQLAVMVAPNPVVRIGVVDRYLLAAMQGGLEALIVVNKVDLDPGLPGSVGLQNYRNLGYRVHFTVATTGQGVDGLVPELAGKLTVFCGHSGVGKSTLLARLTGKEIRTAEVKPKSLKGRQTTVTTRLYTLPGGGEVIDTPGIREFGLGHLAWLDVHEYFTDIAELAQGCSFRDCTHTSEPDCAVLKAVKDGSLAGERLKSYRKLCKEAKAAGRYWEQ